MELDLISTNRYVVFKWKKIQGYTDLIPIGKLRDASVKHNIILLFISIIYHSPRLQAQHVVY